MKKIFLLSLLITSMSYAQVIDQYGKLAVDDHLEHLNGNIGIGTEPLDKFHVKTDYEWGFKTSNSGIDVFNFGDDGFLKNLTFRRLEGEEAISFGNIKGNAFISTGYHFYEDEKGIHSIRLLITTEGNVGIGTSNPTEKLTVNGKILCEEVKVVLDVPADYVFQKYYTGFSTLKADYKMPTLEEVETYIKANHHLPEVPSAMQIKEDGLQLKEMTNLLLQKVEELTLYTIEQEKRIKTLEAKLADKE